VTLSLDTNADGQIANNAANITLNGSNASASFVDANAN
jgi:hypothetical protein